MTDGKTRREKDSKDRGRLKKSERRRQILLELKLRPHVRASDLARLFDVSAETVRRDFEALSDDGLIARAHGGASAPSHYPSLNDRKGMRSGAREIIGRRAAEIVADGETVMIDAGATNIQMARALAYLGTQCTVITNSIPVAMTLGHGAAEVMLCPGEYLPSESAVIGTETLEFLGRFHVDHCMTSATGLTVEGPSETVRGFAAVKRVMLRRASRRALLLDSEKFGQTGLTRFGSLDDLDTLVVERRPKGELLSALDGADIEILVATGNS